MSQFTARSSASPKASSSSSSSFHSSNTSWKTNHSGPKGYIPHEDKDYADTAAGASSKFYNAETKTYFPTKPIRPIRKSYLEIASQEPVTLESPQKLLVILDLNGTLFYRTKGSNRSVTPRPYLSPFLDFLFEHCTVMVWSSAQPHSVEAMLGCGFGDRVPRLARIWTREHFRLPRVDYTRKVLTIKDLEFVWEGIEAEEKLFAAKQSKKDSKEESKVVIKYDQTNTVLIDDSKDKSQLQPHNGLALTDFDHDLARAGTDNELLKVKSYLERLIYQKNVSAYMRAHPFASEKEVINKKPIDTKDTKKDDKEAGDEMDQLSRQLEKTL
ncbi:hypothetical protein EMPS_02772 [Entomortierella parvispora]|uniref:Mitochondrial import inner membrane translocase subunit TIM50 n=1 Tax=Entomortierella parvispora TaxID=205924 RepID=A0A9P3H630_9FUNG|nr:hypothetical protein EMPS_02772 [Entomortierella parvispora]